MDSPLHCMFGGELALKGSYLVYRYLGIFGKKTLPIHRGNGVIQCIEVISGKFFQDEIEPVRSAEVKVCTHNAYNFRLLQCRGKKNTSRQSVNRFKV